MKFPKIPGLQAFLNFILAIFHPSPGLRHKEGKLKIFIIGYMGAGKSFLGKNLAHRLSMPFIDLDDLLEKESGVTINQIFKQRGETYFRKLEKKTLRQFKNTQLQVISTGGGTPCFYKNMSWMNRHGITIYLSASPELLAERLKHEKSQRPLIAGLSDLDLVSHISTHLQKRAKYYNRAKIIIDQDQLAEEQVLEDLIASLKKKRYI